MDDPAPSGGEEAPTALVQEATCAERVVVLKVRVPGRSSFIVLGATRVGASGAALLTGEARREVWGGRLPAGMERQRAREDALVGARVLALGPGEVFIEQRASSRVIRAAAGRVVVTDEPLRAEATPFTSLSEEERLALEARGLELARAIAADAIDAHRAEIARALDRAAARIGRRRDAIRGDLEKIGQADRIAAQAPWLVAEAAKAPRGATRLVVTDWSTGEAVPMEVPLDPSKSAKDQVAAMFKRAKRLRLGARIAEDRLAEADAQLAAIERARRSVADATTLAELDAAIAEAKRAAPRHVTLVDGRRGSAAGGTRHVTLVDGRRGSAAGGTRPRQGRTPYRAFFARSGRRLLVGKGAADNDALTLRVARPHDLWVHAKDRTGAHVIVTLDKGRTCPAEDLVDAAHLAAHFSDARGETAVDVQYTERRYLRKPKGSPPGFVVVPREKVLVLRVEPEILRALLEREEV